MGAAVGARAFMERAFADKYAPWIQTSDQNADRSAAAVRGTVKTHGTVKVGKSKFAAVSKCSSQAHSEIAMNPIRNSVGRANCPPFDPREGRAPCSGARAARATCRDRLTGASASCFLPFTMVVGADFANRATLDANAELFCSSRSSPGASPAAAGS
eukprot:2018138-Prymnesium_polylepis.2